MTRHDPFSALDRVQCRLSRAWCKVFGHDWHEWGVCQRVACRGHQDACRP